MTSAEKRRSSRKSGGRRKHSDGGFSDASSGGSFLDEADREVSSLTDRAFRSLCIGEEAVYNDSDLSLSSPSIQRDRQLTFNQDRNMEVRDWEEQKRAAHENFSLRVQQYGQDWMLGGMCGAEIHRDPQWQDYGARMQGMVSATFQHSLVETCQQGNPLREGELSFFSNGATELRSQQRRSHSRVSSLVRAFNAEGRRDEEGIDNNPGVWSDGTGWDRAALVSVQKELSELSTSYQHNSDGHHFPSATLFSPQDTGFCPPHGMARMSQVKHNMSAQVSCNSNFFIHSEFSPFRLWREHNRFPFQQGDISGFMQHSEFPKWYNTPMYNELSLENQSHAPYRDLRDSRNHLGLTAPPPRSTSTSTVLQKASAMEKRCESELAGHYPHRKWTQSLGANKLPSQRPSTASPTTEMSRRVRDTISSVKALQQKLKTMSDQNTTTEKTTNQTNQGGLSGHERLGNHGNTAVTLEANAVSTSRLLTPAAQWEEETLCLKQHDVSPQPVEHPPVRAGSRGGTPDVRMSSYKSRATSLLFNLKDNRKRVKSTYSPAKFKGLEIQEKPKQPLVQETSQPVTQIPVSTDADIQEPKRTTVNHHYNPGLSLTAQTHQPEGVNPENNVGDYQTVQAQGQTVHHAGFSGFIPENCINYQLANGQNPHENVASFTPRKRDYLGSAEQLQQSDSATDASRLNTANSHSREYLRSQAHSEQAFNEPVGGVLSKVKRYEQMRENKDIYKSVSSQDRWRQVRSQEMEKFSLKPALFQSKHDVLTETSQEETRSGRGKEKTELGESSVHGEQEQGGRQEQKTKEDSLMQICDESFDQHHRKQVDLYPATETQNPGQVEQHTSFLKEEETESQQLIKMNQKGEIPEDTPAQMHQMQDKLHVDSKDEDATAKHKTGQKSKAEDQHKVQVEQPKGEPLDVTSAEKSIKIEESKSDPTKTKSLRQTHEEIKEEKRRGEQDEQVGEKEPETDGEKETKTIQLISDEAEIITDEVGCEHAREEQVKAEITETEELKKEHVQIQPAKSEEAETVRAQQAVIEEATGKSIKPEEEIEAERVKTENTKQTEDRKTQQAEEMKETQTKTEGIKVKASEAERDCVTAENVRRPKDMKDSSSKGEVSSHKAEILARETKGKQEKVEENKQERSKAVNLKESSENLTAKLTAAQPVRNEPDRVEQVKSELAKAKAELAKIKEKMRGDQKEKVKNNAAVKEDEATKHKIPLRMVPEENKDNIKPGELDEMPSHRDAKGYDRPWEKYGFSNAAKTNLMTPGSVTTDANKTEVTSLKEAGIGNNETNKHEPGLAKANTGKKEEILVCHGEPSKEFKLSNTNSGPTALCTKANDDRVHESKDDQTSVRELRDSDVAKLNPLERKADLNEQTTGPGKELPVTSPRVLLHKERAQTKQEILTSRIKAHAEKEISAIREKGLTLREGFIGKGSTKHLASGQSANVRQKPPSQEAPKNQEAFNNIPLKMEHSRLEPAKSEPVRSSATVKSATTNDQLVEHTENSATSRTVRNMQKEVGMKSQMKSKEKEIVKNNPVKEQENSTDPSGRQKEELQQAHMREITSEKTKDQTEAAGVKAANSKFQTTENCGSTKASNHDSEALSVVIGQKDTTAINDSLEITGIMVTIRERNPLMNTDWGKNSPGKQNSAEQECKTSEAEKGYPAEEESTCAKEVSKVKAKEEKKTQSALKEDPAEVVKYNSTENVQEVFILETKTKDVIEKVTDKMTNLQRNSSASVEPQGELFTARTTDKELTEKQSVLFKQDTNVQEAKCIMTKSVKDDLVQSSEEMNQQEKEKSQVNKTSTTHPANSDINNSKGDFSIAIKSSKSIDGQTAPLPEEESFSKDSAENEKLQSNSEQSKEANQDVNVHIDTIAIRVVPSATEEDSLKIAACREEKAIDERCLKTFPSASSKQKRQESLEDKSAVQHVLSSVRKLSDSLKASSKPDSTSTCKSEHGGPGSNASPEEGGYFQIQGVTEASNGTQSSATNAEDEFKEKELPVVPNKTSDGLNQQVFMLALDQTENKARLGKDQEEDILRTNQEKDDNLGLKQADGSKDRQCVTGGREADQHNQSHRKDNQPNSSSAEKLILKDSRSTKFYSVPQKPEAKPKPEGRVSTVPTISALADYARLKVIVSEDKEDTTPQDFPPNKKEGFFPLIQTRPSRRPVFSDNHPNEPLVKDRKLANKTEITTKTIKEPKEMMFPITEKEHQRTGMFKLGGKERSERIVSDSQMDAGPKENVEIHSSHKETNKSPTAQTGTKRLDLSSSQPKSQVVAPTELTDKKLILCATLGQKKENTSQLEKDERPETQQTKDTEAGAEDGGTSRLKQQKLSNRHEETKTKQQSQEQKCNEEQMLRHEKKNDEEDTKIKHMLEESRASLAEEQRKACRREEERRAKEREAVNIMIKERREKQRQSEVRAGEEIKSKQRQEQKVLLKGGHVHTKQKEEDGTENAERKLIKIGGENVFRVGEDDARRLKQQEKESSAHGEHPSRTAKEEQKKASHEREQWRPVQEEQQRRTAKEEQIRSAQVEQQRWLAQGEQRRKSIHEEQQIQAALENQKRRAAKEYQKRTTAEEEKMRTAQMVQQRRLAQEEQRRKSAHDQQQSQYTEEKHKIKTAQKEQQSGAAQEEQHRGLVHVEQQKRAAEEEQRRVDGVEQQKRLAQDEQRRKFAHEEQQRRAAYIEQQKIASQKEQQRTFVQAEQQQKTEQEQGATHMEQQKRAPHAEQQNRAKYIEQLNKAAHVEQHHNPAHVEQQNRAPYVEQQNYAAHVEQHHNPAHVEQQNRAPYVEQQNYAAHVEQHHNPAHVEQQNRAPYVEQQNYAAHVEQQNRASYVVQQNRAPYIEQHSRVVHVEHHNDAANVELHNIAAHVEQQNRSPYIAQQNNDAHVEQQNDAAHVELQNRVPCIEQHNRAAQVEQQNRAVHIEHENKVAHIQPLNTAAYVEQQITFTQTEQQNRAVHVEPQRRAVQDYKQHKVAEDKHELRAAKGERQSRMILQAEQSRVVHADQQTQLAHGELQRRTAEEEQRRVASVKEQRRHIQEVQMVSEHVEQKRKDAKETEQRRAAQDEKQRKVMEEELKQAEQEKHQRRAFQMENYGKVLQEQQKQSVQDEKQRSEEQKQQKQWGAAQIGNQSQTKQIYDKIATDVLEEREGKPRRDEKAAIHPEEKRIKQTQQQKSEELMEERHIKEQWMKTSEGRGEKINAQNEEITRQNNDKNKKTGNIILIGNNAMAQDPVQTKVENYLCDDKRSAFHKENASSIQTEMQHKEASTSDAPQYYAITSESSDDSAFHTRTQRPHSAASPGSSLPRSNTSSPAPGGKPWMFRVKDNTIRGSSLTKSVKPRFHKNFGEDFWMGLPSERVEDEQEMMRRSAGTPVMSNKGLNRSASSLQDYSTSFSHQRSYSRRSLALDEDESRSVISNMSEDVESIATNATDVADVRGLFDHERPESACSFSSDVSRSLGKPPVVPPKSDKALRRAQRLTTRRMKKELSKVAEVSSLPPSAEVWSSNHHAVASPHFSPPIAFAHASSLRSSSSSSQTEHQSSHHSFHASPHATGPISLPSSSPHAAPTVPLPPVSRHASVPAAPTTVAHVSFPSISHLIHPHSTPVTQYQVEPSHYHQSYPLTQHRVLQDLGSGQYFVVEVPVQVKTKTFFDPETGKYVQLNVRQSGQSVSQSQPQPTTQVPLKSQQQPLPQGSIPGKSFVFYQGYPSYPQSYQPAVINSAHPNRSTAPAALHQDQQRPRESHVSTEVQQTSEERRYSPEKTPYMDTVNEKNRTYNPVNSTQDSPESFPQFETSSELLGSEDDNPANSLCEPRDIIAMRDLEDFMEISDW
nr:uncharacterized protein LOC107375632 [Nothobranchius furzeri]